MFGFQQNLLYIVIHMKRNLPPQTSFQQLIEVVFWINSNYVYGLPQLNSL